jgi:hypothetical protein
MFVRLDWASSTEARQPVSRRHPHTVTMSHLLLNSKQPVILYTVRWAMLRCHSSADEKRMPWQYQGLLIFDMWSLPRQRQRT